MSTMTTRQAAQRLGVKVETLYAYVSRGVLDRDVADDGRSSLFDRRAIEALARRGRPRSSSRSTSIDLLIETRLTSLSMRGVRYRGIDAGTLARTSTFEDAAALLWLGRQPAGDGPRCEFPWKGRIVDGGDGFSAGAAIRVTVAEAWALAGDDTGRRDPESMAATGRLLISTIVDSLPTLGGARSTRLTLPNGTGPIRGTIAGRLWGRLTPRRPTAELVGVLNAALVLLADHDLAASTLAARVAASTGAGPYAVVSAGLAALSGPLHGGASRLARDLLAVAEVEGGRVAADRALRNAKIVPGFGHTVYADADPRAVVLFGLLRTAVGSGSQMAAVDAVIAATVERTGRHPNIDLALATLGHLAGMSPDAGEVVMAVARTSGWLAHAIEEYAEPPLRFRPRASYNGP